MIILAIYGMNYNANLHKNLKQSSFVSLYLEVWVAYSICYLNYTTNLKFYKAPLWNNWMVQSMTCEEMNLLST